MIKYVSGEEAVKVAKPATAFLLRTRIILLPNMVLPTKLSISYLKYLNSINASPTR